jgi:hypothetical protein
VQVGRARKECHPQRVVVWGRQIKVLGSGKSVPGQVARQEP